MDRIVRRRRPLAAGEALFRPGQPFDAIYAVRSGAVKVLAIAADGEMSVCAFCLPGDVMGIEGIAQGAHPLLAVALEPTRYCEVRFKALQALSATHGGVRDELLRVLSRALVSFQRRTQLVTARRAHTRLAAFLVDLCQQRQKAQLCPTDFRLPMMRLDIASYLGLTLETVSRALGELQQRAILRVHGRRIQIVDATALAAMSEQSDCG